MHPVHRNAATVKMTMEKIITKCTVIHRMATVEKKLMIRTLNPLND